jgi:hypothetical protein
MALQQVQHSGVYLEKNEKVDPRDSFTDRSITIRFEHSDDVMVIGAKRSTRVYEIKDMLGGMLPGVNAPDLLIKEKTWSGTRIQRICDEAASEIIVGGIPKKQVGEQEWKTREYEHPLFVVGGGLGAIQQMMDFQKMGRKDFCCVEMHDDFGGRSWIAVSNKFTKLQTEAGTYHVDYTIPGATPPKEIGGLKYPNWPSRDMLLRMMRVNAAEHGLYEHAIFGEKVERVKVRKWSEYAVQHAPMNEEDGDGSIMMVSAVCAYQGFLHEPNLVEFPGEDSFGGYCEYSSMDRLDYTKCIGKECVLYGHGAFTIENVRTLCEFRAKKVYVVCRKRNLCGMKIVSWMVGYCYRPMNAVIMLDAFKVMYDLVGFDPWSSHGVQTNETRSYALINQHTIFGVTDIYFLAGYYGLMECVVDEIKRVTHMQVTTKKNRKINCECLIKAIGTRPWFATDKQLGIKEVVGMWVNGDQLRPCSLGMHGVQAQNFGSFSVGPGYAPQVIQMSHFIDYPDDWELVKDKLPRHSADEHSPAYVVSPAYGMPMGMALSTALPWLAAKTGEMDAIKAEKQKIRHPVHEYIPQCRHEWESYIKFFRRHGMVDDRPDPPYPYTDEIVYDLLRRCGEA